MDSLKNATPRELERFIAEARPKYPQREPKEKLQECIRLLEHSYEILEAHIVEMEFLGEKSRLGFSLREFREIQSAVMAELLQYRDILSGCYYDEDFLFAQRLAFEETPKPASLHVPMNIYPDSTNLYPGPRGDEDPKWDDKIDPKFILNSTDKIPQLVCYYNANLVSKLELLLNSYIPKISSWSNTDGESQCVLPFLGGFFTKNGPTIGSKVIAHGLDGINYIMAAYYPKPASGFNDLYTVLRNYGKSITKHYKGSRIEIYDFSNDTVPKYSITCVDTIEGAACYKIVGKQEFLAWI